MLLPAAVWRQERELGKPPGASLAERVTSGSVIDLLQKLSESYRTGGNFIAAEQQLYNKGNEAYKVEDVWNKILGFIACGMAGYGERL